MNVLTRPRPKYSDEVSKAMDRVLRKIFGEEAALFIYKYLEKSYSLRQDEIGEKIDVFAEGLGQFLMSGAYKRIQY